jgi:hypothetical protein
VHRVVSSPIVIGVAEFVDFPEWKIRHLRAKIDTGARSSALHVENIREVGGGKVRFDVRLHRQKRERRVTVEAPIARRGRVRSSNGLIQTRLFVVAKVRVGPVERDIELSLVDREKMLYRMLLGRMALANYFLVDASRRYVVSRVRRSKVTGRSLPRKEW